jgi:hypothetical protein
MATVVDTVILHYFLLVEQSELLLELLQPPVGVPRIVYDPEDGASADVVVSELRRNIRYEERITRTTKADKPEHHDAQQRAQRLQMIDRLIGDAVHVLDMTDAELDVFERLTAEQPEDELGLVLPLGAGEAACIAIALERGHVLATDDTDALRALHRLKQDHPYERIRRLLMRAGENAIIPRGEANDIHRRMREMGFWDAVAPFPG